MIDRQVGRGAVLDEAINDALPKLYVQALQDNDLVPLAQPEIDDHQARGQRDPRVQRRGRPCGRRSRCRRTTGSRPASRTSPSPTPTSRSRSSSLRERFATLNDVERAAADGDFVTIDLVAATKDGEPIEGGELSGYSYQVGRGDMLAGIDEVLAGMSAGDEATFASQLLGGDSEGQEVDVTVTVDRRQGAGAARARRGLRPDGVRVRHHGRAHRRRAHPARARQAPRAGRRRARRRPGEAARRHRGAAARRGRRSRSSAGAARRSSSSSATPA